tara:strand:- start:31 stop:183 length:153 start_codon:yes stop_codon:yes gene_type:complete
MFTDESYEKWALECEQLASWLRFIFGADDSLADALMVRAEGLRQMKRGKK